MEKLRSAWEFLSVKIRGENYIGKKEPFSSSRGILRRNNLLFLF